MEIQSLHQHTPFPIKTGMWNVKHCWTFWGSREVCQGILKGPSVKIPIRSTPQDHSMHDMIFTTPGRQFTIQSPFDLMRWCQISKTTKKTYVSSCFFTYLSYFSVIPQMIYHALSNYLASCCWKKTLGDINFEPGNLWTFLPEKSRPVMWSWSSILIMGCRGVAFCGKLERNGESMAVVRTPSLMCTCLWLRSILYLGIPYWQMGQNLFSNEVSI